MKTSAYFDYCALIILIVVLTAMVIRRMTKGKLNHWFLVMLIVVLLSDIADIVTIHLEYVGPGYVVLKYIAHTTYLLFHILTPFFYVIYIIAQADIWHKLRRNRLQKILLFGPVLVVAAALAVNPFVHIMFYLDEDGSYTRGSCFLLLYIVTVILCALGLYYAIKHKSLIDRKRFAALIALIPIMFVAVVIQFFNPELLVEMFSLSCGILLVCMVIQRPEEIIDSETGLSKLSAYVADVKRAAANKKPLEIIMINIVNYYTVRDMLGYESINAVLRDIAGKIAAFNKKHKMQAELYYLGVGKFRLVIEERHFGRTEENARIINELMKGGFSFHQMDLNLVHCVCIARCPEDIPDVDSLLAFGNDLNTMPYTGEVLYASQIFKKDYYDIRKDVDGIIERALTEHNFSVYYQPIYSVEEKRFNSAEALLRLKDDKYGFVPPDVFIPAAEKSGAIHKIGAFVLEEVCKFIAGREYQALKLDYIEINLSVVQCMRSDLADQVMDILNRFHVRPEQINLEITETAASYSQKALIQNLNVLSAAGITFSLDDFGTGYSNMLRIASLPFHIVKLDKSFVGGEAHSKLLIMLRNTIKMFKAMDLKIVVEGVETEDMVKQFSDMECEYIQGYYYSKPLPREEFVTFIQKNFS
ncbi:MAG: EAL domain-containing protein [Lachnospiraceae bacterium]|nr:EAL domain-containing protein [Lachnospiraceae bacterium]MBD5510525.1 EAL domain-containing protein [Lachnospiraceae bacterium]